MKKQLLVLSAALLCGGVLASCQTTTCSTNSVSTSTAPAEEKKTITLEAEEGSSITLGGGLASEAKVGSKVSFKAAVTSDLKELLAVKLDDEQLVIDSDGNGSFVMPDHDVTLKTVLFTKGDGSLRNVSALPENFTAPTTKADVVKIFEEAAKVEGKFSSVETLNNTYSNFKFGSQGNYANTLSLTAKNSRDNQILVQGNAKTGSSNGSSQSYVYQAGLHDENHFYSVEGLSDYNLAKTTFTLTPKAYDVVETDTSSSNDISKEEAELKSTTFGFASMINQYVVSSTVLWNSDDAENSVTCEKASDGKSFTVTLSATVNSSRRVSSVSAVVDGDNFISKVDFSTKVYASGDWDSTNKVANDGATPTTDQFLTFNAVRDYKDKVEMPYDIEDYVMNDYDITLYSGSSALVDNTISGNSKLSYKVECHDENSFNSIKPRMVAVSEGFGEISSDGLSIADVSALGQFQVTFDNGLGEKKTLNVTSVKPTGTSVTVSLDSGSTIFANEETEITVKVTPVLADQDVTLEKDTSNSGVDVTIQNKGNGVFSIKPLATGKVYVKASGVNGTKTKSCNYTVVEKPTASAVKEALTSTTDPKSVYWSKSIGWDSHYFYINFNADGTGEILHKVGYSGTVTKFTTFKWSIDDTTVAFTFSDFASTDSNNALQITKFQYIASNVITVSVSGVIDGSSVSLENCTAKLYTKVTVA